jgi:excinuclease ABC subunit C
MENLSKIRKIEISKESFNKIPETFGIYIFWKKNFPIYIGKSVNLKNRLNSYLSLKLGPKTNEMIKESEFVSFIKVFSELESLLLESNLIHKFKPKFNIISKDDKHALYIKITKDKYPQVLTSRKEGDFGPFPSSRNVKLILKLVRKIFPFSEHKIGKKPCLYSHIGLCNPCPNTIESIKNEVEKDILTKKYKNNIKNIKLILSRKFNLLRKVLDKKMINFSKEERFEEASCVRDQIKALDYITQPKLSDDLYLENPNLREDIKYKEIESLKKILKLKKLNRIECFDIAHLSGSYTTASMVVFIKGEAENEYYRHFRIKQKIGSSDFDSMKEVSERRAKHLKDWGKPDLIIVDGGLLQIKAFKINVPVVGIAKNPDRLIFRDGKKLVLDGLTLHFLQRIRDEAHRFARRYHHLLIKKNLLN